MKKFIYAALLLLAAGCVTGCRYSRCVYLYGESQGSPRLGCYARLCGRVLQLRVVNRGPEDCLIRCPFRQHSILIAQENSRFNGAEEIGRSYHGRKDDFGCPDAERFVLLRRWDGCPEVRGDVYYSTARLWEEAVVNEPSVVEASAVFEVRPMKGFNVASGGDLLSGFSHVMINMSPSPAPEIPLEW